MSLGWNPVFTGGGAAAINEIGKWSLRVLPVTH